MTKIQSIVADRIWYTCVLKVGAKLVVAIAFLLLKIAA
jgi:hypothetical protein